MGNRVRDQLARAEELADFALRFAIYPLGLAGAGEPVEGVRVQGIKEEDGLRLRNLAAEFKRVRTADPDSAALSDDNECWCGATNDADCTCKRQNRTSDDR